MLDRQVTRIVARIYHWRQPLSSTMHCLHPLSCCIVSIPVFLSTSIDDGRRRLADGKDSLRPDHIITLFSSICSVSHTLNQFVITSWKQHEHSIIRSVVLGLCSSHDSQNTTATCHIAILTSPMIYEYCLIHSEMLIVETCYVLFSYIYGLRHLEFWIFWKDFNLLLQSFLYSVSYLAVKNFLYITGNATTTK